MVRQLHKDDVVTFGSHPPRAIPHTTRDVQKTATLLRPYPGGRYDSGDMWRVRLATGHTIPVSESMMRKFDPVVEQP